MHTLYALCGQNSTKELPIGGTQRRNPVVNASKKKKEKRSQREREMVLYFQQELNGSDPDLADQQPASDAALHCTLLQNIVICLLSGSVMEDANKSLENGQRAESETEDAVSPVSYTHLRAHET